MDKVKKLFKGHENESPLVVTQTRSDDDCAAVEPSLVLERYVDIFSISHGSDLDININYETIPDLIRALKMVHKDWKERSNG